MEYTTVTVVVPCRNEAGWIARCLDSIIGNDYPRDKLEVLVVDGMSDDGTREIVEEYARRCAFIRLLDNPRRITPAALNVGVGAARGEVLMRIDAHYEYPPDYISKLVAHLMQSGADNVGGVLVMGPANDSAAARAIAVAVCHPFGVGNAYYRTGVGGPRWVDTVPFGCYRKEVFQRVGKFDEELVRNQDIEFNLRLRNAGGRTLLTPDVVLRGHARDSLGKMSRMYYQYGYFNPLVIRKLGGRISFRQAVPPLFVLALLLGALLAPWSMLTLLGFIALLVVYALPVLFFSIRAMPKHGVGCGLMLLLVFPALHVSNGLGSLKGMLDFFILRRRVTMSHADRIPITR